MHPRIRAIVVKKSPDVNGFGASHPPRFLKRSLNGLHYVNEMNSSSKVLPSHPEAGLALTRCGGISCCLDCDRGYCLRNPYKFHMGEPLQASFTPDGFAREAAAPPQNRILMLMFVVAAAAFYFLHRGDFSLWWLEDLPVYTRAVSGWLAGYSPYNASLAPLFFLYPPAFLYLAGSLSYLVPAHWGPYIYMAANISAICAIPLILARFFFRQPWLSPLFALLLFFASPRFTGVLALCGMNVASLLYCVAFVAAIPGLRKNFWWFFYVAVLLAAMIKITFLALLLLPILAGRRQWLQSIACGLAVVGGNLAERIFTPDLYTGYQWSLKQAILTEKHYGYGVFGLMASFDDKWHQSVGPWPYIVSVLMAVVLVAGMILLRGRMDRAGTPISNGNWLALVVTTIILVNPREMQYDVDIALLAAFVLFIYAIRGQRLLVKMTFSNRLLVLVVVMFLPSLLMPKLIHTPHLWGIYEVSLAIEGFALGFWRMWRETRTPSVIESGDQTARNPNLPMNSSAPVA
jgi:hypothetical protein